MRWMFNIAAATSAACFIALCVVSIIEVISGPRTSFWRLGDERTLTVEIDAFNIGIEEFSPEKIGVHSKWEDSCKHNFAFEIKDLNDQPNSVTDFAWDCTTKDGFAEGSFDTDGWQSGAGRFVILPFWSVGVVSALLPILWIIGVFTRNHRRRKLGLCPHCGYDVRATPDRCSECGTELTTTAARHKNPI